MEVVDRIAGQGLARHETNAWKKAESGEWSMGLTIPDALDWEDDIGWATRKMGALVRWLPLG